MNKTFLKTPLFLMLLALVMVACGSAEETEIAPTAETPTESVVEPATESTTAETPTDSVSTETDEAITATYTLTETGQGFCYNSDGENMDCPAEGEAFFGQDAQFTGAAFDYTDNGNGTVTDNVTGLTWEQTPQSGPSSWTEAQNYCETLTLGDQEDWRMPSLKELFSISNFSAGWPYLDTDYFDLTVTDSISKDEQYWADNYYVGKTAEGQYDAAFGVNHATGHIKAYPALVTGPMGKYVRCVSGDEYLINDFVDNGDGTITDNATALMWTQADSGDGMDWEAALAYAQEMNEANYLGYSDWRLPNVKELQSIVDYNYAPDAQDEAYDGPAFNPMFSVSEITNEAGELDYPYYWTSTSSRFQATGDFYYAWYIAAGRAVDGDGNDSHGAGAVRFDTKSEDGPAGEGGERYYNYVMLVRGGDITETPDGDPNANDTALALEFTGSQQPNDGGAPPEGGPPQGDAQQPDFAAAAIALGISEEELMAAIGDLSQGAPDFATAAETLGIAEADLMSALGMDDGGAPPAEVPADGTEESNSATVDDGIEAVGDGRTFAIPGDTVFPEGVSYDPATGNFFVGSTTDGTLYVGNVNGDDEMTIFSEAGADGRTTAVGTKVDDDGNLWVAGGRTGQMFVYDTSDGSLIASFTTPASDATFINDMAVTDSGVYFTDSFRPILWRVADLEQGEAEAWLDFTDTVLSYGGGFNLNGIAAMEDGSTLVVVHTGEGELYSIDIASQDVAQIDSGTIPLTGGDGLALVGDTLYVTRNSAGEVVELTLSAEITSATGGNTITSDLFAYPTTIAHTGNTLLVANSQFNNQGSSAELPFTIAQIPLP